MNALDRAVETAVALFPPLSEDTRASIAHLLGSVLEPQEDRS